MRILKPGDKFPSDDGYRGPVLMRATLSGCNVCGTVQNWNGGKGWMKYTDELGFVAFACPKCAGNDSSQEQLPGI